MGGGRGGGGGGWGGVSTQCIFHACQHVCCVRACAPCPCSASCPVHSLPCTTPLSCATLLSCDNDCPWSYTGPLLLQETCMPDTHPYPPKRPASCYPCHHPRPLSPRHCVCRCSFGGITTFTLLPSGPRGALGKQRSAAALAVQRSDAAVMAARTPAARTLRSCASRKFNGPSDSRASASNTVPLTLKIRGAVVTE